MTKAGSRRHRQERVGRTRTRDARSARPAPLQDVPTFSDLRLDDVQLAALERRREQAECPQNLHPACVVRLDRGLPQVVTERDVIRAEHAVAFAHDRDVLPAVGDWVVVRCTPGHDQGVIEEVLPRRTTFGRWRGRNRAQRQVLCANVDTILIMQALGAGELLLDRIARSLVLANDCGARPQVVLTKADRCPATWRDEAIARVSRLVGTGGHVIVTSAAKRSGLEAVLAAVPPLSLAMTLGESGVGKSTLVNTLLGRETLATADVRARDDAGRHTTVARVLIALPGAGVIADAPGLRSLQLVGHERGLAQTFPEIVRASSACRFSDCSHRREPGCAIRAAVDEGKIDPVRLDAFLSIAEEMRVSAQSLDPDIHL
ncbi:ribosome small subunit-dependent GTPase A [Coriobacterium glomerans PW2]|uniref:Small ribosomal subunit biogenesis GTPase RsgA n=2 Tax=Coriobacterium TaxID=33870 RepID=F2NA61_CORGP|nr:ribosome small subunit-dependent GTPase A [Coriobacterium glomerans PW2]